MRCNAIPVALSLTAALMAMPAVCQERPETRSSINGPTEILVLGVYHMSNPGRDVFNAETDDVLSSRRQAEIAEVITVLERFQPTKIAVEARFSDRSVHGRYVEYVAGDHELTRNEIEQLGFRLAGRLGHGSVYPVDVHGEFPFPRLVKFAEATGRAHEFAVQQQEIAERVEAFSAYLASHTVLEALLYMNSDQYVSEDVGSYFRSAEFGEPWDWAGADLLSDWFRRNMRIYSNIVQLVDSPGERVLVIYGAGHVGWLQYAFGANPEFRVRRLSELVDAVPEGGAHR